MNTKILPSDYEHHLITLLEAKRATNWSLGDEYANCVRRFGKGVVNELATLARCSAEHIRQTIRVAVAFPPECRPQLAVLDWSDCREIYQAAKRSKSAETPLSLAQKVIDKDLSMAEVRLLYKDSSAKPPVLRFAATCEICGTRTITYIPEDAKARGFTEGGVTCVWCSICGRYIGKVE